MRQLPFSITSYGLTLSAWLSDRLLGVPDLAEADNLTRSPLWNPTIQAQLRLSQVQSYRGCLFGDSISSGLGNRLEEGIFNFAIGGLSSISLVAQLKCLHRAGFQCEHPIVAIGTNDALYGTSDQTFVQNVQQVLELLQAMGTRHITLLAAFYATDAASRNSWLAGSNQRITEINQLIQQIAQEEAVSFILDELQPFFRGDTLKQELTYDGVHLNDQGLNLFQQVVLDILDAKSVPSQT